jgi:hypothetical protein
MENGRRAFEFFAGLEIPEDSVMHSSRFRSLYALMLPRNYFI